MTRMVRSAGWVIAGVLALLFVGAVAGIVSGGPLDPTGSPAPTGKTLEEIPGSWSRALPANDGAAGPDPPAGCNSTRFQCVMGNAAVLDRETGLVWTRDGSIEGSLTWANAKTECLQAETGGRRGWRLPAAEELQSVYDPVSPNSPKLPVGHPFSNVLSTDSYWSDSSTAATIAVAFQLNGGFTAEPKTNVNLVWCVRTGPGYNGPP